MNIEDRLAVQDVMIEYVSSVDQKDYDRYCDCFVADVTIDGFGPDRIVGVEALRAFVVPALELYRATQHLIGPSRIRIDGDRAHARTDIQASHYYKDTPNRALTLWGTYETDFASTMAGWKILHHVLVTKAVRVSEEGYV